LLPNGEFASTASAAVNVDFSETHAEIKGAGVATGSAAVVVRGQSDLDAFADADASSVDTVAGGFGLAPALAINVVGQTTDAVIAGHATGPSITVEARMTGDGIHTYEADALAGAGQGESNLAGAIAINVARGTTEARVDASAVLTFSSPGPLTIHAAYVTEEKALAHAKDTGLATVGVGASFAFNVALN